MDLWFTPKTDFMIDGNSFGAPFGVPIKDPKVIPKNTMKCIENFDGGMLQIDQTIVNNVGDDGDTDITIGERIISNAEFSDWDNEAIGRNGYEVNLKDDANITDYSDKKNYTCTLTCPLRVYIGHGLKCNMKVDCVEN